MAADAARNEFVPLPGLLPGAVVSAVGYRMTDSAPRVHRGLPSPALTLVLSLDEPIVTGRSPAHATGPQAHREPIVLGGLHTGPAFIAQPCRQAGIQLAVRPCAARELLGLPAGELGMLGNDVGAVLGPDADRLREQLQEAQSWAERYALLAAFLRRRSEDAARRPGPRPEITAAWQWIARHRGAGSMEGLARHVLLSRRQLTELFRAELGVTPKAASRLMRFECARQQIVRSLGRDTAPDLSEVAHASGYYDHSHLVRDFRQYAGTTPTGWLAEERRNIQAGAHQRGEDLDA
ncbi:helix-turn-helix domain-containing protein [Streptomyces sp. XM4193]|uniref:AraC family transcriptional regulator n=1 Tax=Streptomyces sp. XM4193 TaxID=2929782 RepID=UPI001FF798FF|nr:helix-turn-helix domain-containing protein [Streptomyces sp. XM4193]MCK1797539.1 helix-turn-helix domain-containing protein [Streptomyces sp. XM4193]